ncbi:hypothetical protein Q8A67_004387 [Cirrhinus molitorella]|uniref:Uncharacterized protein n=1 Tax=Cirrhinus molitorella TaxID=172907 RepID=A0AA88TSV1_9TELE|nr:hypothetical protein Q8A67_004387 [Cirrhinus molitorella]
MTSSENRFVVARIFSSLPRDGSAKAQLNCFHQQVKLMQDQESPSGDAFGTGSLASALISSVTLKVLI